MRRQVLVALGLALGLLVGAGGRASGDSPPPFDDVDGLFTCVGQTRTVRDVMSVSFSSTGPHYPDGTVLRLAVLDIRQPANALVAIRVDDDTVVLPDGWWSEARGWPSEALTDDWGITRTITGVSVGTKKGSITWGLSVDGGPMERYTVATTAEVAACVSPATDRNPPITSTSAVTPAREPARPIALWLAAVTTALIVVARPSRRHRRAQLERG